MRHVCNLVVGFFLVASLLAPAQAAPQGPQELIEHVSREVIAEAREDPAIQRGDRQRILELVRSTILPHVDFARMTALAAGQYWRSATPEQRNQLVAEFRDLLVHVYSGAIGQVKDKELVFKAMRGDPASGNVEVRSEVVQKTGAEPIQLSYRLSRGEHGWKIYDVSVLGVWLVQSYRDTFVSEIRQHGIEGLISTLSQKNEKLAADMSRASPGR